MKEQKAQIAVFIDAGNLWNVYRDLGRFLDLGKLEYFLCTTFNGSLFRIFYYTAYPAEGTRPKAELDRHHQFLTFLKKKLRFYVVKKVLKRIAFKDSHGEAQYFEKGNFDVELTIDAMHYLNSYDIAVLMSGDSDFLPLIRYMQSLNTPKKVYVFSTKGCVSRELRTDSDGYFDLAEYSELHGKIYTPKANKK